MKVDLDRVPQDVRPEQFMTRMIEQVLAATSVSQHVDVRRLNERRELAVVEEDEITDVAR